ncbi:IS110 family transposase [Sinosporangium siamense]|uniref:IS110 family transposase n=2 Tax=Sinosporangium siamense TaxID=1367973 RepID=A0A919V9V9_9ACTN|nr:IS110 family transposase [Sinosporangium siamense]GII97620.1 IS110 family transposase [Sinosporangium siamense]
MPHTSTLLHPDPSPEQVILGVDTHKDVHVAAAVTAMGAPLGSRSFPACPDGYRELVAWARSFGVLRRAGVECTGSYGAALARVLIAEDISVFEVGQPDKAMRRRRGKSDEVDAEAAARAVLSGRATAIPKSGDGPVETARLLRRAKESAVKARTQAINQLRAVLVVAGPELRASFDGLGPKTLIRRCAELAAGPVADVDSATVYVLRLLATRVQSLSQEIDAVGKLLEDVVRRHAPALLERVGVGPDTAAALLVTAGDNPERLDGEGSFAALCGVSPVEASSGKSQRRRLNRGGDRQANAALYRIVLTRLRWDDRTREYLRRRTAEGKTRREVIRCLKRYVAREIFGLVKAAAKDHGRSPV